MDAPSPALAAAVAKLGAEYRIETVVLRATGPYRWDVCGLDEYEGRMYGSVTAVDGPKGVLYRYTLRNFWPTELARLSLGDAVREIVSDWPEEVDPSELVARAEALLDTAETLLNDRHHEWSGDYATLLDRIAGVTRKLANLHDHVHDVAMVIAADLDVEVCGMLAERCADTAEACTKLGTQIEASSADAVAVGLSSFGTPNVALELLASYRAARSAEACAGRTAAEQDGADR